MSNTEKKMVIGVVVMIIALGVCLYQFNKGLSQASNYVDKHGLKSVVDQLWNGAAGNQGSAPDSVQQAKP